MDSLKGIHADAVFIKLGCLDDDCLELLAVLEGTTSDACNSRRDRNAGKASAVLEGFFFDLLDILADRNLL